uniref:Uncharacterized protein n=1 Tax=Steinernema glaseri TaxID=37863 RepID=A0A1I8AFX6_9BILA
MRASVGNREEMHNPPTTAAQNILQMAICCATRRAVRQGHEGSRAERRIRKTPQGSRASTWESGGAARYLQTIIEKVFVER